MVRGSPLIEGGVCVCVSERPCLCICEGSRGCWSRLFVSINVFMHWRVHVYVWFGFFFRIFWLKLTWRLQNVSMNRIFGKQISVTWQLVSSYHIQIKDIQTD